MIAVIDYGMGNLMSVQKAVEHLGFRCVVTANKKDIDSASHIILPGVGAFRDAMKNLKERNLIDVIIENCLNRRKPLLGICLGMQVLFEESEEFGIYRGIGLLKGRVVRFNLELKVPHMGWNTVKLKKSNPLIDADERYFYFVHSYYVVPSDESIIGGTTEYGINFPSYINSENIHATQFHPEKSEKQGLKLLKNFCEIKC
jgi:glutamine amidotransferase